MVLSIVLKGENMILEILEIIKETNMPSRKDISSRVGKEPRYVQACLDVLEELQIICTIKKGQFRSPKLTPKGEKLLNELKSKKAKP